jgi:hypothetical protein
VISDRLAAEWKRHLASENKPSKATARHMAEQLLDDRERDRLTITNLKEGEVVEIGKPKITIIYAKHDLVGVYADEKCLARTYSPRVSGILGILGYEVETRLSNDLPETL